MGFLDKVEMAFTCPLAWEKLTGDGATRFCGDCQQQVTDLSALSRAEASALMRSSSAPACVRIQVDAQGRSLHRPDLRRAARRPAAAALSVALLAPAGVGNCSDDTSGPVMMGEPAIEAPVLELMGDVEIAPQETAPQEIAPQETAPQESALQESEFHHELLGGVRINLEEPHMPWVAEIADQLPEPTSGVGAPAVESCPLNDDADETRCDR